MGWHQRSEIVSDPRAPWILGKQNRLPTHGPHEGEWQVRLGPCASDPCTTRNQCCGFASVQENACICRHHGWFLLLLRPHAHEGQLHEGMLRSLAGNLRIPHSRPLEAHAVLETTFPGTHRLPCPVQAHQDLLDDHSCCHMTEYPM